MGDLGFQQRHQWQLDREPRSPNFNMHGRVPAEPCPAWNGSCDSIGCIVVLVVAAYAVDNPC